VADTKVYEKDPIVHGTLGPHLAIAALVMAATVLWAFYDEMYAKRPWLGYQEAFVERYGDFLEQEQQAAAAFEGGLKQDKNLQELEAHVEAARAAAADEIAEVDRLSNEIANPRVTKLTKALTAVRSEVSALIYLLEHAEGAEAEQLNRELEQIKQREIVVADVPALTGGAVQTETYEYASLSAALEEAKAYKAKLLSQRAALDQPRRDALTAYNDALDRKRPGLSSQQIGGLINKIDNFDGGIQQIHIPDPIGLVDRCETCHLAIREPLAVTTEDMGGESDLYARAFASHPNPDLLQIHDPEQFGCTPCHGGNGAATISVKEGHGKIKHWLWPLYDKENAEAGCLQCHESSLVLTHADTLNAGKEIFRHRGCWGCHPREGFDTERSQQRLAAQAVRTVAEEIDNTKLAILKLNEVFDADEVTDAEIAEALSKEKEYTLRISGLESELIELQRREISLAKQLKMVGPSLRPIKQKLRPEWVTQWIRNPHDFRPTTRMPVFRLNDDHLHAIAATVWQAADPPNGVKHPRGDADKGEELFEARGCLGCHALEKDADGNWIGGMFAPELSRMGEKANYDYIVEWIKDTPDWSLMPNLRLSVDEARDIASYLMEQKDEENPVAEEDYAHLDDPELVEYGAMLVRHYGCAGCHNIAGFENVGKIGTELTTEGNKPIERLDFGLHTHSAKRNKGSHYNPEEISYDHKSFFQWKLRKPEFFDEGKHFEDPLARSRMPNFGLTPEEENQVVTYLLGSVDSDVPEQLKHEPTGHSKDIMEGWWVIKKYNCMGCHQITPDHTPEIAMLPQYQGENAGLAPPSLVGVGARLNPEWLAKFLRNPAMRDDDLNRNGVRSYLQVRMPTFNLWDEEIGALVRFFEAMSKQTLPYFPPPLPALSEAETQIARNAFLGADCLNCHASAAQATFDKSVIAPSFVHAKERLKPSWTKRWILDPGKLMIGTRMPAGLFRQEAAADRWIVAGTMGDDLAAYDGDHADLFVRYMNTIDVREATLLKDIKDAERSETGGGDEEFFDEDEEEEEFFDEDEEE
jgi:mono/diheme cytochrome c family protein